MVPAAVNSFLLERAPKPLDLVCPSQPQQYKAGVLCWVWVWSPPVLQTQDSPLLGSSGAGRKPLLPPGRPEPAPSSGNSPHPVLGTGVQVGAVLSSENWLAGHLRLVLCLSRLVWLSSHPCSGCPLKPEMTFSFLFYYKDGFEVKRSCI